MVAVNILVHYSMLSVTSASVVVFLTFLHALKNGRVGIGQEDAR